MLNAKEKHNESDLNIFGICLGENNKNNFYISCKWIMHAN